MDVINLPRFILASLVAHALAAAGLYALALTNKPPRIVEISFGTGHSRGGSSDLVLQAAPAPAAQAAPLKVAAAPELKSLAQSPVDAPEVVQKKVVEEKKPEVKPKVDKVQTEQAAVQRPSVENGAGTGNGVGYGGSGSGTGYTSGAGGGFSDPMVKYRGLIHQLINAKEIYPAIARRMRHEGRVMLRLKLSRDGKLLLAELAEKTRHESLNQASLATVKSLEKFPELPSETGLEEYSFLVPIEYETIGDMI